MSGSLRRRAKVTPSSRDARRELYINDGIMDSLKRSLPWLALAALALLAGGAGFDLRLVAGAACGIGVLAGTGVLAERSGKR
jgi:hypothetical protein